MPRRPFQPNDTRARKHGSRANALLLLLQLLFWLSKNFQVKVLSDLGFSPRGSSSLSCSPNPSRSSGKQNTCTRGCAINTHAQSVFVQWGRVCLVWNKWRLVTDEGVSTCHAYCDTRLKTPHRTRNNSGLGAMLFQRQCVIHRVPSKTHTVQCDEWALGFRRLWS